VSHPLVQGPTWAGPETPRVVVDLAEAGEEPRVPPGVQQQRRPAERRWGEGPRHPRTARATCEWCQSTICRRMATESHPMSHHGRPTVHRQCVRPCDREPPEASSLSQSSRGQRSRSAVRRNPPPRRGQPEVRCRVSWWERWLQRRRGEAPREADRSWPPQRWETDSCG
jgi:hypothetical protein